MVFLFVVSTGIKRYLCRAFVHIRQIVQSALFSTNMQCFFYVQGQCCVPKWSSFHKSTASAFIAHTFGPVNSLSKCIMETDDQATINPVHKETGPVWLPLLKCRSDTRFRKNKAFICILLALQWLIYIVSRSSFLESDILSMLSA